MRYNHGYLGTDQETIMHAADTVQHIQSIYVCNTSGSNTTYSLWHCPKDETNSDEFALFFESRASAKTTVIIDTPIHLHPGEKLIAAAGVGSAVVLTVYIED